VSSPQPPLEIKHVVSIFASFAAMEEGDGNTDLITHRIKQRRVLGRLAWKMQDALAEDTWQFIADHFPVPPIMELVHTLGGCNLSLSEASKKTTIQSFASWYIAKERKQFGSRDIDSVSSEDDPRVRVLLSLESADKAATANVFSRPALCCLHEGINRIRQRAALGVWGNPDGYDNPDGSDPAVAQLHSIFHMSISIALDSKTNAVFRFAPNETFFCVGAVKISPRTVLVMKISETQTCGFCLYGVDTGTSRSCPRCACQTYCSEHCRVQDKDHKEWCREAALAPKTGIDIAGLASASCLMKAACPSDFIQIDRITSVQIATSRVYRMDGNTKAKRVGYVVASGRNDISIVSKDPEKSLSRQVQCRLKHIISKASATKKDSKDSKDIKAEPKKDNDDAASPGAQAPTPAPAPAPAHATVQQATPSNTANRVSVASAWVSDLKDRGRRYQPALTSKTSMVVARRPSSPGREDCHHQEAPVEKTSDVKEAVDDGKRSSRRRCLPSDEVPDPEETKHDGDTQPPLGVDKHQRRRRNKRSSTSQATTEGALLQIGSHKGMIMRMELLEFAIQMGCGDPTNFAESVMEDLYTPQPRVLQDARLRKAWRVFNWTDKTLRSLVKC
jgi:hypothetical protein